MIQAKDESSEMMTFAGTLKTMPQLISNDKLAGEVDENRKNDVFSWREIAAKFIELCGTSFEDGGLSGKFALLTGSSFVGSHLIDKLLVDYYRDRMMDDQ